MKKLIFVNIIFSFSFSVVFWMLGSFAGPIAVGILIPISLVASFLSSKKNPKYLWLWPIIYFFVFSIAGLSLFFRDFDSLYFIVIGLIFVFLPAVIGSLTVGIPKLFKK